MKRYHVSENKFDKSTATLNKRVTTSGTTDYTGAFASDFIPISENVNCTITGLITTVVTVIYFYDSSNTNIGYISVDSASSYSFITPNGTAKLRFTGDMNYINTASVITYTWQTKSPPKYGTATETIQSGDTIYANGQPITTYTLKGNTVQNGTPSPSNPVDVVGVGERTENLFNESSVSIGYWISSTGTVTEPPNATYGAITDKIPVNAATYTLWYYETRPYSYSICWYDDTDTFISRNHYTYADMAQPAVITAPVNATSLILQVSNGSNTGTDIITNEIISSFKIMLNAGSTALPYEPYGYKIPILNNSQTTNIYTAEPLMRIGDSADNKSNAAEIRAVKKLVLDGTESWSIYDAPKGEQPYAIHQFYTNSYSLNLNGIAFSTCFSNIAKSGMTANTRYNDAYGVYLVTSGTEIAFQLEGSKTEFPTVAAWTTYLQQQYSAGTPVTVWYQLATPITESVTAPSIPTTEGANTITVDTTVQPSEFTATWTGWHDSSVKEYDGTDWQ